MTARFRPQSEQRPFITTAEVAALLCLTPASFRLQREALIEDHAFPEPMPLRSRSLIWRRDMVEGWIAQHGRARALPPAPRPQGPNVVLMEEARRA